MTTVGSFVPALTAWLRRVVVARADPEETPGSVVTLASGQACTVRPTRSRSRLVVVTGVVWATTTPPDEGDIVLRADESLDPDSKWPMVIQAIEDARFRIT